jgi:pyridoxine 5-phosphate synthase
MGDRGQGTPSVVQAVSACIEAGAPGITVHPRADARHITMADVREVAAVLAPHCDRVEYNIEGDPRRELVDLVERLQPAQFTLVPVRPGEITSQAGWPPQTDPAPLRALVRRMNDVGVRVSVFVDPQPEPIAWAASLGAQRVELFTEPFALAFAQGEDEGRRSFEHYIAAAEQAHALGLGVNAGHDLDENNLVLFRELPHLDEVSIGHALVAEAVFYGLSVVVRRYLDVLRC